MAPLDLTEIDIPTHAFSVAAAAALAFGDLLIAGDPVWRQSGLDDYALAEAFAGVLAPLNPPLGEVLFLEGHERRWWLSGVPRRFAELRFEDREAFNLIASVFGTVRDRLTLELKRQEEERRGQTPALPPLKREDSIDEKPGQLTDLIEGAGPQPVPAAPAARPRPPKPAGAALSIGEAPPRPPRNRGGRGRRRAP